MTKALLIWGVPLVIDMIEDSIYLHATIFDDLKLYKLFSIAIPHFYYYGATKVNKEEWEKICLLSVAYGGKYLEVANELAVWVEGCFRTESYFVICGI